MDSINPEYLAAKLLSETGADAFQSWILPGNLILGKYPILAGSYYHGPLQVYLSLPVYMVMGLSIESARTAQCLYALAILLVASRFLVRARVGNVLMFVGLLLLALDPGFVQVFKTQGLSNLWPLSLYLLAILLLDGAGKSRTPWLLLSGGVLLGLAFFSYFIYLFFVPVAYLYSIGRLIQAGYRPRAALRASLILVLGFIIGTLPYCVGFYLLYDELGSFSAFAASLHSGVTHLEVLRAPVGGVLGALGEMSSDVSAAVTDVWLNAQVLGQPGRVDRPGLVAAFFLGIPFVIGGLLTVRRTPARFLHVVNASIATYLLASLPFVARFGGHHYVMLLPLGYLAWILAIHYLREGAPEPRQRRWLAAAGIVLAVFSMAGSIQAQTIYLEALARTGGVGTYTDALNRFAADAAHDDADVLYFLPDWGFMMPLQFLTAGKVVVEPSEPTVATVRRLVCVGEAVAVVYDLDDPDDAKSVAAHEYRLEAFKSLIPGSKVDSKVYDNKDGSREFTVATLRSDGVPDGWCGAEALRLPRCEISADPGVTIVAEPCDIKRCTKPIGRRSEVHFSWDARRKAENVEVWVGDDAIDKKLWLRSVAKGQARTGPWAYSGMQFELRDAKTGETLARAKLGGEDCGRR